MKTVFAKIIPFLGIFLLSEATENDQRGTVKVSVYYETLCPGSIQYITEDVFPNYEGLKDNITMDWIPYGHANHTKVDGKWTFECQHGDEECRGNMYQACALDQKKGQKLDIRFINCAMSLNRPWNPVGIKDCANDFGFDWSTLSLCANTDKGKELLAALGDRTKKLTPKIKYVPTTVYNDDYDLDLSIEAFDDFLKTTCSKIPEPKPSSCIRK